MNIRIWGILVALLAVLGSVSYFLSTQQTTGNREEIKPPPELSPTPAQESQPKLRNASKQPGRVVVLKTNRGTIEFVLYEKDCPKTTERIAKLVESGAYNGVDFPRVENWLIQTNVAKKSVDPMGVELTKGLTHVPGTVGMARAESYNSNTSVFYILTQPAPHLDAGYTNFGRVIRGMDVVQKIALGDKIKSASIRSATSADKQALQQLLASDPRN